MNASLALSPVFTVTAARSQRTAPLGEVLPSVYEEASRFSTDPAVVARLVNEVMGRILRRTQRAARA